MKAGDFKAGAVFRYEGKVCKVISAAPIQQPRLAAFMRTKFKNIETGQVLEENFGMGDFFPDVDLTRTQMQFSYEDGGLFYFMDLATCDLVPVDRDMCEHALVYNSEENPTEFTFEYADGKLYNIAPPNFVVLTVVDTEAAVAGDTARSALKNAKLDSGLEVKVPMFVVSGDKVKIDTRDGTYSARA